MRNPLVSPDIIGINAALGRLLWIVTRQPLTYLPAVAFAGGLAAAVAIYALTWRGHISGARLILVGMGMNAMLTATTTYLLTRAEINDASRAVLWMTGSVYGSDWADVRLLTISLAVLVPVGAALMRSLRVLQLGDLTAHTLGMPVERIRLFLMMIGCALSGIAVSVAGPIGFVALMVPHFARMLAGSMTAGVFFLTGLLGAALVLGADMIGQHAAGVSLPVGVVTSALGAPYFLFLLYRTRVCTGVGDIDGDGNESSDGERCDIILRSVGGRREKPHLPGSGRGTLRRSSAPTGVANRRCCGRSLAS